MSVAPLLNAILYPDARGPAAARENNVPVAEDQNLAEVLEALDVDVEIPAEPYHAVAEVLVFVYRLNRTYGNHQDL